LGMKNKATDYFRNNGLDRGSIKINMKTYSANVSSEFS
jgi:hypothetical protein